MAKYRYRIVPMRGDSGCFASRYCFGIQRKRWLFWKNVFGYFNDVDAAKKYVDELKKADAAS